jgi:hypothetical protein
MPKKYISVLLYLLLAAKAYPQINLEATYNYSGTFTELSQSGYKFYVMDVGNNQCRMYNTNHSLWKTINLAVPANHYLYDIRYVSENLFTTDNSIALAYTYYTYDAVNEYYTYTTRIVRENGSLLLQVPGCALVQVVEGQALGTKMLAFVFDYSVFPYTVQTQVHNLPGNLVGINIGEPDNGSVPSMIWPNPASLFTNIAYQLPGDAKTGELMLFDMQGRVLKQMVLDARANTIIIPTAGFPAGTYSYLILADGKKQSAGKLVVQ